MMFVTQSLLLLSSSVTLKKSTLASKSCVHTKMKVNNVPSGFNTFNFTVNQRIVVIIFSQGKETLSAWAGNQNKHSKLT